MRRIDLYLLRHLAVATLFATLALTFAIWLTQSLHIIELVIDGGAPFSVFLKLVILTLPTFLGIVLPLALVGAVLFTYNRLTLDSELVVMRAVGIGPGRLCVPALIMAGGIWALVMILNVWVTPAAFRGLVAEQQTLSSKYSTALLRDGTFNDVSSSLTVYVRNRGDDGTMHDIVIEDARNPGRPVTIIADRGVMVNTADGPRFVVFSGVRQQYDPATGKLSLLSFDRYAVDMQAVQSAADQRWREPRERTMAQLLHPRTNIDRQNVGRLLAEFHQRLATPFFAFSFTLIALATLLSGEFSRRGQGRRILLAIACVFVLQAAGLGIANAAARRPELTALLYVATILPGPLAAWLLLNPRRRAIPTAAAGLPGSAG